MPRTGRPASPTSRHPAGARQPATAHASPAVAARLRQLAAQAEHRRAVAEFRARHAADQQDRINALLLEAIDALASLLAAPNTPATARPGRHPGRGYGQSKATADFDAW